MTLKIDRAITMLDAIRTAGVPVDGIGFQAHVRIDWPSVADIEAAFTKAKNAGYAIKVSELDMTVYNDYPTGTFEPAPELAFDDALSLQQATAYGALFGLFRTWKDDITSVTLWGVSDDATWLDNEPQPGRDNYPLLWNDAHEPKDAYFSVRDF